MDNYSDWDIHLEDDKYVICKRCGSILPYENKAMHSGFHNMINDHLSHRP